MPKITEDVKRQLIAKGVFTQEWYDAEGEFGAARMYIDELATEMLLFPMDITQISKTPGGLIGWATPYQDLQRYFAKVDGSRVTAENMPEDSRQVFISKLMNIHVTRANHWITHYWRVIELLSQPEELEQFILTLKDSDEFECKGTTKDSSTSTRSRSFFDARQSTTVVVSDQTEDTTDDPAIAPSAS